jgi:hypothetical protein
MKPYSRRVSAVLAVILFVAVSAGAAPAPRDNRDRDLPAKIARIIQKIFGVTSQADLPLPPRP